MRHFENEKSDRERDVSLEEKFFSPEQIQWNATESAAWCAEHSGVLHIVVCSMWGFFTVACRSRQCRVFSIVYCVEFRMQCSIQCAMF